MSAHPASQPVEHRRTRLGLTSPFLLLGQERRRQPSIGADQAIAAVLPLRDTYHSTVAVMAPMRPAPKTMMTALRAHPPATMAATIWLAAAVEMPKLPATHRAPTATVVNPTTLMRTAAISTAPSFFFKTICDILNLPGWCAVTRCDPRATIER